MHTPFYSILQLYPRAKLVIENGAKSEVCLLLFAGNVPRGVFVSKAHRETENCGAKRLLVTE